MEGQQMTAYPKIMRKEMSTNSNATEEELAKLEQWNFQEKTVMTSPGRP